MSNANCSWIKWSFLGLTFIAATVFCGSTQAQSAPSIQVGGAHITGVPQDWTTHHVVFSDPGTEQDAIQAGRHAQWQKIVNDPRYVIHQLHRNLPVQGPAAVDANYRARWISEASGSRGAIAAPPSLLPSFGLAGHSMRPIRIGVSQSRSQASTMNKDWNQQVGTATASTAINYPAKWSFATNTESCTNDFVVFPTGQVGSAAQATILADYNLYTSCGGTNPTIDWQYNTGTGSSVVLAPVFSLDGSQVAFIQTTGTAASLVLLRFKLITTGAGTISTLTSQSSAANYYNTGAGCTTPCMFTMPLSGGTTPNDTWSSPYYEYGTDTLFVGDAAGKLHKFTPVFRGNPAEITTGGWPAQMVHGAVPVTDNNQLASPIYDPNSGFVFVGSSTSVSTTTGGWFYAVNASTGAIHAYSSVQIDNQYGVRDAPLFDPVAQEAYVFAGHNVAGNSAVYLFPAAFTSSTTPTSVSTGAGATSDDAFVFAGAFDNTYYTSSNEALPTGNLYACASGLGGTLYKIAITSGALGTATAGPTLTDAAHYGRCGVMTEFFNSNTTETAAVTATGTATAASNPALWAGGAVPTVTIGTTAYTFVTGAPTAANQVEKSTASTTANNEDRTAQNFRAVINATSAQCFTAGCVFASQAANASVTATVATNIVTLTSKTAGAASNFTLTSSTGGDVAVAGGSNGADAVLGQDDLLFSNFAGTQTGCTNSTANGCVMSWDITSAASFSTSKTPLGTLNVASQNLTTASATNPAAVTSGIIIDNNGTAGGESQMYFLTQDNVNAACVTGGANGICAIQVSQSAP
jgi:hypothetical protein